MLSDNWELPEPEGEIPGGLTVLGGQETVLDTDLVRRSMEGDEKAFTDLFYLTYRFTYSRLTPLLPREEDLRDALQETYLKVWEGLPRLREPTAFLSWLSTVAHNAALDLRRKSGRDPTEEQEQRPEVYLEENRETGLDVQAVLSGLPEEEARLLVLVYYDGLSLAQIARMQQIPASTVRSRFARAKRHMQAALKARGIDRAAYSRAGFITTVATAMRDAVGTDLLSAATAQEILDGVLKQKKEATPGGAVAARLVKRQRDMAVLRLAALVLLLSVLASAAVAALILHRNREPERGVLTASADGSSSITDGTLPDATAGSTFETDTAATGSGSLPSLTGEQGENSTRSAEPPGETRPGESVPASTSPASGQTEAPVVTLSTDAPDGTEPTLPAVGPTAPPVTAATTTTAAATATATTTTATKPTTTTAAATTTTQPVTAPTSSEEFVPDYRPGHANLMGNSGSATARVGWIAIQDNWVYWATSQSGSKFRIDKVNTATGELRGVATVSENPHALSVVGDWIYYGVDNVCRMRTDGSLQETLIPNARLWGVRGQELFFGAEGYIRRMDLSTGRVTNVSPRYCYYAVVTESGVYTISNDTSPGLYRYEYGTGAFRYLCGAYSFAGVGKNAVYFYPLNRDTQHISRYDPGTGEIRPVFENASGDPLEYCEVGDVLLELDHYRAYDLTDVATDGSNRIEPEGEWVYRKDHDPSPRPVVIEDWVYWRTAGGGGLYRAKWNGKGFGAPEKLC